MFTKKLLLDMDTGVDDALAIAYAVGCGAEIAGITCGFGNVETAEAVRNTLDLLSLLGRPEVPVFAGDAGPDGQPFRVSEACRKIHGENGIGNVSLPRHGEPSPSPPTGLSSTPPGKRGMPSSSSAPGRFTTSPGPSSKTGRRWQKPIRSSLWAGR